MNRRLFLKSSGSAMVLAGMPLSFNLFPKYKQPAWVAVDYVEELQSCSTLVQYNKKITKKISPYRINGEKHFIHTPVGRYGPNGYVAKNESVYIRQIALMQAAPNVGEEDIIAEIEEKWNDDGAMITTVGAEGAYLNMDEETFRSHLTIGTLKEFLNHMKYREDNEHMDDYKYKKIITKDGKNLSRKWRVWYDKGYRYSHVLFDDSTAVSVNDIKKGTPRYSYKAFAREMVSGRDKSLEEMKGIFKRKYVTTYQPDPQVYPSLARYHGIS